MGEVVLNTNGSAKKRILKNPAPGRKGKEHNRRHSSPQGGTTMVGQDERD